MTTVAAGPAVALVGPACSVPEAELGGKGAALARLARHGFAIPPTGCVTASAYRIVAADVEIVDLLDRIRDGAVVPAEAVDAAFLAVPVPDAIRESIAQVARQVGDGDPVAIRSSATVEDMAAASFAGQYRSSLDVLGEGAVLRAVRLTWASLWHPAPCAYRRTWGIADDDIAMAVVVMRMVPARLAGVAFTLDPAGAPGRLRVEAVSGLGESLVSGERTPDVWLLPRTGGGGPAPAPVLEAAAMAMRIERVCGSAQDVEWAWDGERLWLVQARPITAGLAQRADDCETPVDGDELTTNGIGEMLPGVLSPLLWDVNSFLVEEALRNVLGELRGLPGRLGRHELVRRVHGRAALNLDLIAGAAQASGGSESEIRRQYFGGSEPGPEPANGRRSGLRTGWRLALQSLRAAGVRRRAIVESDVLLAAVAEIGRGRPDLSGHDDRWLLAYRRRLVDLGARAMTVELAVAAAAVAAYQQVEAFLVPHLGQREAAAAVQQVTAGAGAQAPRTGWMSRAIFAGPTWAETGGVSRSELPPRRARPEVERLALERRLRANPSWRRVRILTGQVVDVRMHLLRRLTLDATEGLLRRERVKAAVLQVGGEVRRVQLEIGRRLAGRGGLAEPSDIDLLRDRELARALAGRGPAPAVLSYRRRWLRRWLDDGPLPVRFAGSPATAPANMPSGDRLTGWAASPGRHTGRARVVTDPLLARLAPGEVLVAAATDAGWSPLFVAAGAIVVERGGPLSHAAIVARELGVPAVLNLAGATAVLDGRLVTVDGDAGLVIVHPENGGRT